MILDLGLPDIDGLEVCRRLRRARPDLAILILTARDQELDVVAGLDAGADDYLVKPFRLQRAARARARAPAPRAGTSRREPEPLRPDRSVDPAARRAWRGATSSTLRPKEFDLLALLIGSAGRVVTRERIMEEVWDTAWMGSTKTLDTHVLDAAPAGRPRCDHDAARRRLPLRADVRRRLVLAIVRRRGRWRRRCSRCRSASSSSAPTATRSCCACSATRSRPRGSSTPARSGARPGRAAARPDRLAVYDRAGRRIAGRGPAAADTLVRDALRSGRAGATQRDGRLLAVAPAAQRRARRGRAAGRSAPTTAADATRARHLAAAARRSRRRRPRRRGARRAVLGGRLTGPLDRLAAAARRLGTATSRRARRAPACRSSTRSGARSTPRRSASTTSSTRERAFSADASHQLRTPLAALRIELEALELRGERGPELAAALREVDRLQADDRRAAGARARRAARRGPTDLGDAVGDAAAAWRGPLAQRSRPLRVVVQAPDPTRARRAGLGRQILDVLLSNACEHGAGEVTVTVRESGDFLAVDVHDEGAGRRGRAGGLQAAQRVSRRSRHRPGARELARARGGRRAGAARAGARADLHADLGSSLSLRVSRGGRIGSPSLRPASISRPRVSSASNSAPSRIATLEIHSQMRNDDHAAERAVGLVVAAEVRDVERERAPRR